MSLQARIDDLLKPHRRGGLWDWNRCRGRRQLGPRRWAASSRSWGPPFSRCGRWSVTWWTAGPRLRACWHSAGGRQQCRRQHRGRASDAGGRHMAGGLIVNPTLKAAGW